MDSKAISVRIPPSLLNRLDKFAKIDYPQRNGKNPNRSQIILDALEFYFENRDTKTNPNSSKTKIEQLEEKINTLSYNVEQRLARLEDSITSSKTNQSEHQEDNLTSEDPVKNEFTNAELARLLGVNPATISRWSTGKRQPPKDLNWRFNPTTKLWSPMT